MVVKEHSVINFSARFMKHSVEMYRVSVVWTGDTLPSYSVEPHQNDFRLPNWFWSCQIFMAYTNQSSFTGYYITAVLKSWKTYIFQVLKYIINYPRIPFECLGCLLLSSYNTQGMVTLCKIYVDWQKTYLTYELFVGFFLDGRFWVVALHCCQETCLSEDCF